LGRAFCWKFDLMKSNQISNKKLFSNSSYKLSLPQSTSGMITSTDAGRR
jgi:hypothetical protein